MHIGDWKQYSGGTQYIGRGWREMQGLNSSAHHLLYKDMHEKENVKVLSLCRGENTIKLIHLPVQRDPSLRVDIVVLDDFGELFLGGRMAQTPHTVGEFERRQKPGGGGPERRKGITAELVLILGELAHVGPSLS